MKKISIDYADGVFTEAIDGQLARHLDIRLYWDLRRPIQNILIDMSNFHIEPMLFNDYMSKCKKENP